MRILRGEYKGRNLVAPRDIRPVSVLVRKACFDILSQEVSGRRVLDLFAGSGALGIEALSSGAQSAVFVDVQRPSIEALRRNLKILSIIGQASVFIKDAASAVKDFAAAGQHFDLIFLDPPY
ncbi:MAG: RsmD family RNA methyltransferase, partial [Candidatus Omnitrophica bacterium]|nr:RsmD family RNA methyltransferase [Candidatus Omnitrophota bacterium]